MNEQSNNSGDAPLRGVFPVFQTPFNDDETIDAATLQREIEWLFERGANGVVMALASELLRLGQTERIDLTRLACKFGRSHGAVVVSVGAESSKLAEEFARLAEGLGASAVMAIPPISARCGESELLKYFERIIRAITLPLIVQDASGYVGQSMSVAFQAGLLQKFGERVLFKPEATPIGPRLSELRDATNGAARVFEGTGGIALVDSFRRGIVGTMPGADLIDAIVAIWSAMDRHDDDHAYAISTPLAALISMVTSLDMFLAIEKHLLVKQGIFRNTIVRGPSGFVLDRETAAEIDRLFARIMDAVATKGVKSR